MTDTKHPEALRLAALYDADAWPGGLSLNAWAAASASELRRLYAENATLQAGYDAARLEIDALKKQVRFAEMAAEAEAREVDERGARLKELRAQIAAPRRPAARRPAARQSRPPTP